ncbi:MAG TPA: LamG domain-containing protein [Candidatus Sulfotelmatobacter sp.]|nr:LamG domain-containing protein [Candidatus Sulfotelmatobacter sp.]
MTARPFRGALLGPAATLLLLALCSGCAGSQRSVRHAPRARTAPPPADSLTLLLWHMDETGGSEVTDAGPLHLLGLAGPDTRTDFGRIERARLFTRSIDSFVACGYADPLESPAALTVEAWVRVDEYGQYEDTPIAGRWTPNVNEHSWLFTVLGRDLLPPIANLPSPGQHQDLLPASIGGDNLGKLMFAFQPRDAGSPLSFVSNRALEIGRWTHVAVSYDGRVVRFYVDGNLDAQYAVLGAIRPSPAPLLVGNSFDPRWLTNFGTTEIHVLSNVDRNPYYAFVGAIDELRISNAVRTAFPYVR